MSILFQMCTFHDHLSFLEMSFLGVSVFCSSWYRFKCSIFCLNSNSQLLLWDSDLPGAYIDGGGGWKEGREGECQRLSWRVWSLWQIWRHCSEESGYKSLCLCFLGTMGFLMLPDSFPPLSLGLRVGFIWALVIFSFRWWFSDQWALLCNIRRHVQKHWFRHWQLRGLFGCRK